MQFTLGDLTRRRAALPMSRQMKPVLRAFSQLTIASHPSTRPVLVSSRRSRLATCTPSLARTSVHSKSITSNQQRNAGSASNSQWKARQRNDHYVQKAKVQGLKSRAAYKLLELDKKHGFFKKNQTIVDLGYAPGSWSQVARERTQGQSVIVGIDLIPAQPPRGVTGIQGDFLSPQVRRLLKGVLLEQVRRKRRAAAKDKKKQQQVERAAAAAADAEDVAADDAAEGKEGGGEGREASDVSVAEDAPAGEDAREKEEAGKQVTENGKEAMVVEEPMSYIDMEKKMASHNMDESEADTIKEGELLVDFIMSDMSEPWPQISGFQINTLSRPYRRLMNTSGMPFRDHAGSMDLCYAALSFASDNLKPGGNFICKFYPGNLDKELEGKMKKLFEAVQRQKPESSRDNSKELYFICLGRKCDVTLADIEAGQ